MAGYFKGKKYQPGKSTSPAKVPTILFACVPCPAFSGTAGMIGLRPRLRSDREGKVNRADLSRRSLDVGRELFRAKAG